MKKIILYIIALSIIGASSVLSSCSEDSLSSQSVVIDSEDPTNEFDVWIDEHYRAAYNMQFKYKYEDIESDMTYTLVPAEMQQSIFLAKLVKYLWLEAYSEVGGLAFMRAYVPRIIHVVGTVGYNVNNGTYTLGTAEGGLKITLYAGNWLDNWFYLTYDNPAAPEEYTVHMDADKINFYYLHTMHHEFGHILHQTKDYSPDFKLISAGNYTASWTSRNESQAAKLGFISPYAGAAADEDFVETLSFYVTLSDAEWAAKLTLAGTEGAPIIQSKLQYVKDYMLNVWNIDLDVLKEALARRYAEIYDIDWVNL